MSATWIKLLDSLHEDPRVFRMGELLAKTAQAYILAPSADLFGPVTDSVTRNALRDVTIAGLSRVWRAANRHTTTGVFPHATLDYLDTLAQIPGFGAAMAAVGYAQHDPQNHTVTLPRFTEHNSPDKNGERSKTAGALRVAAHREKKRLLDEKLATAGLTGTPIAPTNSEQVTPPVTLPVTPKAVTSNVTPSLSISNSKSTESTPLNQNSDPKSESDSQCQSVAVSGSTPPASSNEPLTIFTLDAIKPRINALRPAWIKLPVWGNEEDHALLEALPNLQALDDRDWSRLEAYMKWANSTSNQGRDAHKVTSRRQQFLAELPAYLDRANTHAKHHGAGLAKSRPASPKPPPPAPADLSLIHI